MICNLHGPSENRLQEAQCSEMSAVLLGSLTGRGVSSMSPGRHDKTHGLGENGPSVSSEQRFALSRRERISELCCNFGAGALLLGLCLYILASPERTQGYRPLFLFFAVAWTVLLARYVLTLAREEEWLGATFLVSSDGIAKVMPSGRRFEGRWSQLVRVSVRHGVWLEFSDGTHIDIRTLSGPFLGQLIEAAELASGPDSPLSRAMAKERSRHKLPSPARLYLYGQLLAACIMLSSIVYFSLGDARVGAGLLRAGLVLSPILFLATYAGLRIAARRGDPDG